MLKRKMLRDICLQKVNFIAIFILMMLGCFIFSGITSEYHGMEVTLSTFLEASDMADATLYGNSVVQDDDRMKSESLMQVSATVPNNQAAHLEVNVINKQTMNLMQLKQGTPYQQGMDGVWLDEIYANAHHLTIGDTITFRIADTTYKKTINALILSCDYIYQVKENGLLPDHENNGYVYIDANSISYPYQANKILIQSDRTDLKKELLKAYGSTHMVVMQEVNPNISMLRDEIEQHKQLGITFAIAFLGIACMVVITTMHRLLTSQKMQIFNLYTLGFTRKKLYLHYATHCSMIILLSSILGVILGQCLFSSITYPFMEELYNLPPLQSVAIAFSYWLPGVATIVSAFISLYICRSYVHHKPVRQSVKQHKRNLSLLSHISFITKWNLRDVTHNKLRSFMSVLGVCGCCALFISAFGIYTTIQHVTSFAFSTLETYDCKVSGVFSNDELSSLITTMDGNAIMENRITIQANQDYEQIAIRVLTTNDYLALATDEHTFVTLHDGIAISKTIADKYHLEVGDTLTWRIGQSDWQKNRIEAILRTPLTQGITIMRQQLEKQGLPFVTTSIIGKRINSNMLENKNATIQYHEDLLHSMDTLMEATQMMIAVFSFAAMLLGSVILYNLGSLTYMERYHELASLKVLGFQQSAIQKIVIQQHLWLTLLGVALSIIAGRQLLAFMLSTIQDTMDIMMYLPWYVLIGSCILTLMVSMIISIAISQKIKHIDMVAALKDASSL